MSLIILLTIFVGTDLVHEIQLLDLPTAVCTFMMDDNEPAVAVSSGTNVFVYKTIRPYFKFTLPLLEVRGGQGCTYFSTHVPCVYSCRKISFYF